MRWRVYKYAFIVALIAWLYFPIVLRLAKQWYDDPDYSHGFLVPIFSLFVLMRRWPELKANTREPSNWGFAILALGMLLLIAGVLGSELFLSRISLLIVLAGAIVFLFGWRTFRIVLFPWAFLFLMIPIPAILLSKVTFPLQMLASFLGGALLPLFGVPVLREGNIINLPAMPLEVAEACSGVRSVLSLLTFAIVYGSVAEKRKLIRVWLALASIPVAVSANSLRIVVTGLLAQYWDQGKAQGFFHEFSGWVIFVISFGLLMLLHRSWRGGVACHWT